MLVKGRTAEANSMRRMNRVLLVEDFLPFRAFVSALLREKPNLQIVSEASDGFQAVRRARELHPDLILMDLGLPGLNGIEAARRIRQLVPRSRIVFLSQEGSAEIVEEALRSGALGYVLKPRAGDDLHPAVAAVLEGQQFVSDGLIGSKEAVITPRDVRNHRAFRRLPISGSCVRGPSAKVQRNRCANYGAAPGLGIDEKFPMDQFQAFLHAR